MQSNNRKKNLFHQIEEIKKVLRVNIGAVRLVLMNNEC